MLEITLGNIADYYGQSPAGHHRSICEHSNQRLARGADITDFRRITAEKL